MSEGFRIARGFVEVDTEDNTDAGLSRARSTVMKWGNDLSKKITGYFTKGFDEGTAAAHKAAVKLRDDTIHAIEDINAKKLQIDADVLRATSKIGDLKKEAETATGDKKIQVDADIAAAVAKLAIMEREADKLGRKHIELKVDLDRQLASRALADIGQTATSMFTALSRTLSTKATELAASMATSIGAFFTGGGAMTAATGGINLLVGAVLALAGALALAATGMVVLAPLVLLTGGMFGSLFTAVAGGVATFFALKLGLGGISDAFGEVSKDGKATDETLSKLSLNGQRLVHEFEKLQKPLDLLKKFVQDKLLDQMSGSFRDLAGKWIPAARDILGNLATVLNGIARSVMDAFGKPEFIDNMKVAAAGFGDMLSRIGASFPGLIDAFGRLAKASVPFLNTIGDLVGGLIEKFSAWIKTADGSGALTKFMQDASKALRDIWDIGGLVVSIMGDLVGILFPGSKRAGDNFLESFKTGLEKVHQWLSDPKNQKAIQDWIDKIQDFGDKVVTEWIPAIEGWVKKIEGWANTVDGWVSKIKKFKDDLLGTWDEIKAQTEEKWNGIVLFFQQLPERVTGFLSSLPSQLFNLFTDALNQAAFAVGVGAGIVIGFFLNLPGQIIGALIALPGRISALFNDVKGRASGTTGSLVNEVSNWFSQLPGRASGALSSLPGTVSNAFNNAKNAATSTAYNLLNEAAGILSGMGSRAASAVGNLGGVLWNAGSSLIQGLIRGIESQIPGLRGVLKRITDMMPDWKGPLDKDKKLLEPAGKAIMGGLRRGIDSEVPALRDQLTGLTSAIGGIGAGMAGRQSAGGATNHFAPGSIVLDASKLRSIQDLIDLLTNLQSTSRQFRGTRTVGAMA